MSLTKEQAIKITQMTTDDVVTVILNRIRQELPPIYQSSFKALMEPSREDLATILTIHSSCA